jgi:glycyl-tRNA synthetase beta chain
MARDILLEIGTEELPAGFLDPALAFLERALPAALHEARLSHGPVWTEGTPRRLVVVVEGVADGQEDRDEEVTGPKAEVAWDSEGELTKAGEGFLRGRGLDPQAAYRKDTKKGAVMAVLVHEKGAPADEVLPELLSALLPKIPFKKTMRWTDGKAAFGRPVRWLLALLGDTALPVHFADVTSGRVTYGHRFHFPEAVEVTGVADYQQKLAQRRVVLSRAARRRLILDEARRLAADSGGALLEDEELLHEVANLVEHPWPVLGRFEERFLEMPKELLLSEMKEHQRYFGVAGERGALQSAFIVVAGSEPPSPERLAAGNARVLRSRFEDGAFYFAEDGKHRLEERAARLDTVLFQRDLGTLADKTRRVCALTDRLAALLAVMGEPRERALRAAHLAKADLLSGVVSEFPELQGTMGRYYALRDGEPTEVALAVEEHYQPKNASDAMPSTLEGALVGVADRTDTLVGILAVGKPPSGSADPFGLRRAAIAVLRIALHRGWALSLPALIEAAADEVGERSKKPRAELMALALDFLQTRLRGVLVERLEERGLRGAGDIVDAVLGAGASDPVDAEARALALARLRDTDTAQFDQLAATFKRVGNLLHKARGDGLAAEASSLDDRALFEAAEQALVGEVRAAQGRLEASRGAGAELAARYAGSLETIVALKPHVDRFFDDVMVMVDDEKVRTARLGLLATVESLLVSLADFTRIQGAIQAESAGA